MQQNALIKLMIFCVPNSTSHINSHTNTQDTHAPFLLLDLHLMHTSIQQNNTIHARRVPATGAHTSTSSLVNAAPSSIYEMEGRRQRKERGREVDKMHRHFHTEGICLSEMNTLVVIRVSTIKLFHCTYTFSCYMYS